MRKTCWHSSNFEVVNIWKSYMRTAGWRIKWRKIIAVINATFAVTRRKPEKKIPACTGFEPLTIAILHPAVLRYDFHIFTTSSSSFHGFITNQFNDLLSVGLLAQMVAALHPYRRGQGFDSRTSLNLFEAFFPQLQKLRFLLRCSSFG